MKILLVVGIIAIVIFSVWYAKRKDVIAEFMEESNEVLTEKDNPIDFGYKNVWIVVKTDKRQGISKIIGLTNVRPSNWRSGIESAYQNGVFITPQIGDWTLVVGMGLPNGDNEESIEKLATILNTLSLEYGEAHFYGTHRGVEYHSWMKSINGKMERVYSYLGESGENIKVYGEPTESEEGLNLFNSFSDEAKSDGYWDREDLDYPDEELVIKIAENWSVNPTRLTERKDIKEELGIIGYLE